ncbi:MAG: hypothetical protein E5W41_00185 [Mesorhizobium sp.]|nr:MAG: hypothetical protein E5W41_00185 [Mesorhizobium sp.]
MIKAFLPTGKSLDEQFAALSIVKTAHETSDYSALLKAASIEEVKTEQKTRRIEDQPQTATINQPATDAAQADHTASGEISQEPATETASAPEPDPEADVPAFLKKDKKPKAA